MNLIIDGQLIHYADEGKGPVLLFLHGWGANLSSFDQLAAHFQKSFRIVRLDFPGFGKSPKPDTNWDVSAYSNMVAGFINKLELGTVHAVIGHSFGGRVIIKGIAGGLIAAKKVVLIDSAGVRPSASFKKSLYKSVAKAGKAVTSIPGLRGLRPALRAKLYGAAGATDYLDAKDMRAIFLQTINEDLLPYAQNITQPTLLIWGENDTETPVGDAYRILNELPNGQLKVVQNAGHFVFADDLATVIAEIEAFV